MKREYGYAKILRYLPGFVAFVYREFPVAYLAMGTMLFGVLMEYAALSVMIPLSGKSPASGSLSSMVSNMWHAFAAWTGLGESARTWVWLFLLIFALRMAANYAQTVLNGHVAKHIFAHLSTSAFARVVSRIPLSEIYRRSVGHYVALAGDESFRVGMLYFYMAQAASALIAALIGLFVLYLFSPEIFALTMLFLFVVGATLALVMRTAFRMSSEAAALSRNAHTIFLEALNGLRSIRSMGGERYVGDSYLQTIASYAKVLLMQDVFNQSTRTLPGLLLLLLAVIALYPGADRFHEMSVVYFFAVVTMLVRVLGFLGGAVGSAGHAAVNIRALFELDDILGKHDPKELSHGAQSVERVTDITFSGLHCGYASGDQILSDAGAVVSAGRSYAIVGKSGSGKSTLADVLLGLLTPTAGTLSLSGVPYNEIEPASLRRRVILVEQQTRIFSGTIRENIAFGQTLSDDEIQEAIEAADLAEFVRSLPRGLDTQLEYQGANLSGGQRQRVGLARALVRHPDVLILDEATSALDPRTRDAVVARLRTLFRDKILIFITHDAQVVDTVDEVWHIRKGTLVAESEQGRRSP